jgi:hypothetical protein
VVGSLSIFVSAWTRLLGCMWPIRVLAFNIGDVENRTHFPNQLVRLATGVYLASGSQ